MEKVIIINNSKDYVKLLKHIKYYKIMSYFNITFEIQNNIKNDEVHAISKALNIKKRKKRIEYVYDEICRFIDSKNKNINICGFEHNKCHVQLLKGSDKCNGCCRTCLYQSTNGCLTKNLACKMFYCSEVKKRYKVLKYDDLNLLKLLSWKQRFIIKSDYFSLREDVLKDLYSISIIYSSSRILYRMIRNYLLLFYKKKIWAEMN